MSYERGNSSNYDNNAWIKEHANLILTSISLYVKRIEELVLKARLAFVRCTNPTAVITFLNNNREIESLLSEALVSLRRTRSVIYNVTGESSSTAILQSLTTALSPPRRSHIARRPPRFTPQNQALLPYNVANATSVQQSQTAALSLQQSQVAPRPDISSNSQTYLLSNRADILSTNQASLLSNRAAVHQRRYSARPYNVLAGLNQARVPSGNYGQVNQASYPPGFHPHKRPAIAPLIPQPNRAALPSSSQMVHQNRAALLPPAISRGNQPTFPQSLQQVPSLGSDVGGRASEITTRKRRLEALYGNGPNNEIPEGLRHLEAHLVRRIMAEIVDQDATVKWDEIAGLEHAKSSVLETVLWPVLNPRIFEGVRSVGKGVLLFGPPGTGKTMIGKAIAGEMKATFFNICASSLTSKWLGEGENLVRALFAVARHLQPSVIFLDEIDAVLFRRSSSTEHEAFRRIKTQLLVEMEGVDSGSDQIIVIGATNRPQDIDAAARGRLSKRLYIPLPTTEARLQIVFKTMEKGGQYALSEQELDRIGNLTDGYAGSDMKNLVKEAMMGPIRDAIKDVNNGTDIRELEPDDLRAVDLQDFENALKEIRPSVSQMELAAFVEWNRKFGSMSI